MAKAKNADAGSAAPSDGGDGGDTSSADIGADSNDTIAGIAVTEPAPSGGTDGGDAPRKRGRPAGSGAGKSKSATREKAAQTTVKGIEKILFSIHMMAAKASGIDELEIDNEEAKLMSDAVAEVASHYNYTVDPKTMAWVGFIGTMGAIYGPRIAVYNLRKSMEKASKPAPAKPSAEIVGIVSGNAPIPSFAAG